MDFIKNIMLAIYCLPFWKLGLFLLGWTAIFFYINRKFQKKMWWKCALLLAAAKGGGISEKLLPFRVQRG